jgi:hypothetical protein
MGLTHVDDFLYDTVDIAIWSTVEPGIGIAAACVITFRPILQKIIQRPGWWTKSKLSSAPLHKKSKQSQTRSYALSQSMPTLRPDYVGNYTEITSGGTILARLDDKDIYSSTELLALPSIYEGPGISKKVEVTFTESEVELENSMNARWSELKIAKEAYRAAHMGQK